MFIRKIGNALRSTLLTIYYRLKLACYRLLIGREALSYVLYESLRPDLVLKIGGAHIGENTRVNRWLTLHESLGSFKNLTIGKDVHIGKFVLIDLSGRVTIGDRVGIGMFAKVLTHQNLGDSTLQEAYPREAGDIVIPDDVVIAAGASVLFPTRLAPKTLVSAGSVVRGEYKKPCVLVGNPARPSVLLKEGKFA